MKDHQRGEAMRGDATRDARGLRERRPKQHETTVSKILKRADGSQGGFYIGKIEFIMFLISGGVSDQALRRKHGYSKEEISKAHEILRKDGLSG